MFAIVKTGGKQYKVAKDDVIRVEKLEGKDGSTITFDEVLLIGDDKNTTLGTPLIAGASVKGKVVEQTRDDKVIVFKKKRRQNYRRKLGHKQHKTLVQIIEIKAA
tara:strand:+ start:856 stop:1170 length:315 start_codon:yes stop_codon:yes gene_type:complete